MAKISFSSFVGGLFFLTTAFLFLHTFDAAYQTSILTAGRGPVFFPRIILGAMALFSLIVIVEGFAEEREVSGRNGFVVMIAAIAITGGYILSINMAGFVIPTLIFTFVLPFILGYTRWKITLVIAIIYTFAVWYIFERVFLIILPSSPWFEMI